MVLVGFKTLLFTAFWDRFGLLPFFELELMLSECLDRRSGGVAVKNCRKMLIFPSIGPKRSRKLCLILILLFEIFYWSVLLKAMCFAHV